PVEPQEPRARIQAGDSQRGQDSPDLALHRKSLRGDGWVGGDEVFALLAALRQLAPQEAAVVRSVASDAPDTDALAVGSDAERLLREGIDRREPRGPAMGTGTPPKVNPTQLRRDGFPDGRRERGF